MSPDTRRILDIALWAGLGLFYGWIFWLGVMRGVREYRKWKQSKRREL